MSLTAQQLEMRRHGIGGSEIAAVLGLSKFRGPWDVWLSKRHGVDQAANVDMERGTFLEPALIQWYLARTLKKAAMSAGTVKHARNAIALCTPDLMALDAGGIGRLVSIKAPRGGWDWGPEGTDEVPEEYLVQQQWEHAICASFMPVGSLDSTMDLAALVDGQLRIYPVEADLEVQGWLLESATEWWRRHIIEGVEPELDDGSGARAWLRRKYRGKGGTVRQATPQEMALLLALRDAKERVVDAEKQLETATRNIEDAIGEDAGVEADGIGRVTWKRDKNDVRVMRMKWPKERTQQ
jgi:predicted phage-related endonuclease